LTSFLIIDDHPLFREALGNAVRLAHPDARIFEAMSIKGAFGILAAEQGIDLALLDLSLPARNLSQAARRDRLERRGPTHHSRSAVAGCCRLFAEINLEERVGALDRAGAEWLDFRSEQFRHPERTGQRKSHRGLARAARRIDAAAASGAGTDPARISEQTHRGRA
jgi:CheY-like chemotaxis protein